ncbi:MAG: pseudouridine synthase [Parachlamydiales bacterium]|jgi:23S rRNA pseudouridine1911/1915/1917 synthase
MIILYQDNHVLAAVKPAGIPTQGENNSFEALVKAHSQKTFLYPVHRLDTPVSGIVLFATSSKALSRLNESLRNNLFTKTYLALVQGKPTPHSNTLTHSLFHDEFQHKAILSKHPKAKQCQLCYETITSYHNSSLLKINLITGRYHQIRAQLSAINHPVLGDAKYNSHQPFPQGIALHHSSLSFPHPTLKNIITLSAPLPDYFKGASPP